MYCENNYIIFYKREIHLPAFLFVDDVGPVFCVIFFNYLVCLKFGVPFIQTFLNITSCK